MASSIQKKSIELTDRALLEPLLRACNLELSEYSFANLYLFRKTHRYELVMDHYPYIEGVRYDKSPFIMPTSKECFRYLVENGKSPLFPIPDEWAAEIEEKKYDPAESDYLYQTERLATYQGRHLSKKRNLVKQFKELYSSEVCPFEKNEDAEAVLTAWRAHVEEDFDLESCREAIKLREILSLEGKIYYVEGRPAGFMLGEALREDIFVLHFAKADITYKGIYQFMYQEFASGLLGRFLYINMEQDLGLASLRQAKHSYEPCKVAPKYILFSK